MKNKTIWEKYSFLWVTLAFFILSLAGHWLFGWYAFIEEEREHGVEPEVGSYVIEMTRDTLENWQSEFLQLVWQVAGLAFLLYAGSPQSKEGDDRKEEKIDLILQAVSKTADKDIQRIEKKYGKA
jgi:hypothetical protein